MDLIRHLMDKGRLLSKNAESDIYLSTYLGKPVIIKRRVEKKYRDPRLDLRLRISRTYREAKIIKYLKANGVKTPILLSTSLKDSTLVMEYISGKRLSEVLNSKDMKVKYDLLVKVGRILGILHKKGIVHGDPHPSNFIIKDGEIYLIDFGLSLWSSSIKDQVYDIDVIYRSLNSLYPSDLPILFDAFKYGYINEYPNGDIVLKEHDKVLKMGRYHER